MKNAQSETAIYQPFGNNFRRYSTRRAAFDFYPTPPEATWALLNEVKFEGSIWEPACGDGAISKVLDKAGYETISTDLIDRGYGIGGINFLHQTKPLARNIVTNPPYGHGLGDMFIRQAITFCRKTGGKVAMLCNLSSLCYPSRNPKFIKTPPKIILGLDELICWPNGDAKQATYSTAKQRYCWIIWEMNYSGRPEFWWLSTKNVSEKQ